MSIQFISADSVRMAPRSGSGGGQGRQMDVVVNPVTGEVEFQAGKWVLSRMNVQCLCQAKEQGKALVRMNHLKERLRQKLAAKREASGTE